LEPKKVIIIGPAYPLRGGLATFDQRLCEEFNRFGSDASIYSFSLQYPAIFFPGKTQFSSESSPNNMKIFSIINSISPTNWIKVGTRLKKLAPDVIVVRYWLPFMGPCLGTILRITLKNRHSRVIAITDNVRPHEKRLGDRTLTKYFLNSCEAYVTMSEKVTRDLLEFNQSKPIRQVLHPLYDNFGSIIRKRDARAHLGIDQQEKVILFFGFIRKYKGLDILLDAMADPRVQAIGVKLLVAGEFYEDEKSYLDLIEQLGIKSSLILKTDFIPDSEVKYYLCAADAVVQPYRHATQSGVTPLAYYFEKPMIVTNVGGLPKLVPDRLTGIVAEPRADSIASAILMFYELGENYFIPHLRSEKQKYSWANLVNTIFELADDIQK